MSPDLFSKGDKYNRRRQPFPFPHNFLHVPGNSQRFGSQTDYSSQLQGTLMSNDIGRVLRGPPVEPIPDCSLGEYLLPKIRSLPQDRIVQVEGDTGAKQTVGEFLEMGIRVSEGLRRLGLKPGDIVGMFCLNCLDTTAIVLGSWLSAAVIAPMPVSMTVGEIKYALELLQPKFLFCDLEAAKNLAAAVDALVMSTTIILMENTLEEKPQQQQSRGVTWKLFQDILPEVDVDSYVPGSVKSPSTENVTILFSSGTTGLPKGVGITHKNFIFQDINMQTIGHFPLQQDLLQISQFFWVTAHSFLIRTLTVGTKRVMLRRTTQSSVLKAIEEYKPNWSMMTPVFAVSLTNHPDFGKYNVSSLKLMLLGGSSFTPSMGEKLKEKWKGVELRQCYGTTELTGTVCFTGNGQDLYSLGRVTSAQELKIADVETGKPLKANVLGEICVKSEGMMKSYFRNEPATKAAIDEDGWFHTGDLGYYDESEQVYLVDRLKDLVKMMGMQVSPTEVENTILSIPGILEAAVVGVTEDEEVYELLAFVVKQKDSVVTEKLIQEHVAGTLSQYKHLTGGVVFVESLPKTSSGKMEKKKIRKMAQELYSKRHQRDKLPNPKKPTS